MAKLKERRLSSDLQTTFDNFLLATTLGNFIEPLQVGFKDTLPQVRKGVASFCERAVLVTYIDDLTEI